MDDGASDILIKYKHQPMLEKRHEQLKPEYNVTPAPSRMWRVQRLS